MTFRTSISSKGNPRELLKRGFKSMFHNYQSERQQPLTQANPADKKPLKKSSS